MDSSQSKRMEATLTFVVEKLARSQFTQLTTAAKSSRLSASEIQSAIADYGIDIALPSNGASGRLDVYEIIKSNPTSWSVDYDLIDRIRGQTDLTLQLTLIENRQSLMDFEIDDIHVL